MADFRAQILLRDYNARNLDMIVNESGFGIRTGAGEIVDVIETVRHVGCDLHPRDPRLEIGEARVPAVAEAVGEAGAGDELVDEEDDGAGDRRAEEFHEAAVVAPADEREAATELRKINLLAEVAARNDDVALANYAAPGGRREARGREIGGCGGDLGEVVDVRVFRERVSET